MGGLGVMIEAFSDDNYSAEIYKEIVGKKITSASFGNDAITLHFEEGPAVTITDEGQSCCENRYMTTDDSIKDLEGKTLVSILLKEAPSVLDEYDDHDVQFLEINTNDGAITFASHNEHTGYYGGFAIELQKVTA